MTASGRSSQAGVGQQRVGHCRPRTSAIRSLNLGVSFPAVRSRIRPALAARERRAACTCAYRIGTVLRCPLSTMTNSRNTNCSVVLALRCA